MGQGYPKQKSSSEFGSIYIQTDQPFYFTNSIVTGNIHLQLYQPYPAKFIDIQIKGKEKAKFKEYIQVRDHQGQYRSQQVKRKDDLKILYTRLPIADFTNSQSQIAPGMYSFPFQFQLSSDLPSSVIISQDKFSAKVKYSVKAIMEPLKHSGAKKIKFKQRLIVRQESKGVQYGGTSSDKSNVTSCCCFGKGQAELKGSFEKNFYTPFETARATAWIDNSKCSVPVSRLALQLKLVISLKADHHHFNHSQIVAQHNFPGIEAQGDTKEPRFLDLDLSNIKMVLKNRKKKEWGEYDRVLGTMAPSNCSGKLVNIHYVLQIDPKYDDLICCTTYPKVGLPMFLLPGQLPMFGQVQTPQDWQPQVYPMYNFQLQNQAMIAKGALPDYYLEGNPLPDPLMPVQVAQPYYGQPAQFQQPQYPLQQAPQGVDYSTQKLAANQDNQTFE